RPRETLFPYTTLFRSLGLIDAQAQKFLWVTDFPMFEWDAELERWDAVHHPFTRPTDESRALLDTDPGAAKAVAYDLVANGIEIRSEEHTSELQSHLNL